MLRGKIEALMGEAELKRDLHELIIHSTFYFYGDAASQQLSIQIADDIAHHWNEPKGIIKIKKDWFNVRFDMEGHFEPDLKPETVWYDNLPRNNYFRIE